MEVHIYKYLKKNFKFFLNEKKLKKKLLKNFWKKNFWKIEEKKTFKKLFKKFEKKLIFFWENKKIEKKELKKTWIFFKLEKKLIFVNSCGVGGVFKTPELATASLACLIISSSDFTVQISLAKWSWPKVS